MTKWRNAVGMQCFLPALSAVALTNWATFMVVNDSEPEQHDLDKEQT